MIDFPSFIFGFIAATMIGLVFQQVLFYLKKLGAANKPMSVIIKTDKTPNQIRTETFLATIRFVFWLVVFIGLVVVSLYGLVSLAG